MNIFSRFFMRTNIAPEPIPPRDEALQSTFGRPLPQTPEFKNQFRQFVHDVNMKGGNYHKINFGDGIIMNGEFDMVKYVDHYGIPKDLTGSSVLDIGTGSGYFAFECARRGGQVTAIDIWDEFFFNKIRQALGFDVRYIQKSIYDLEPSFGKFDFVVCGSVLLHLRDIFGAIEKIRSVCKGQAIIATAAMDDSRCDHRACCEVVGIKTAGRGGDYWVYWHVNTLGLTKMLLTAGFSEAQEVATFVLTSEPGQSGFAVPHIVVKGLV